MTPSSFVDILLNIGVGLLMAVFTETLISVLRRWMANRGATVVLRFPSGRTVKLDLDARLPSDTTSDLVEAAVRAAAAGDEPGVQRAVEASHAASRQVRAEAA